MYPEENDVTASAPGVAVNGGDDVAGLVFDNATERPPVVKPCSLGIELIDSCVKKRIELRFGFTAWFDDVRVHDRAAALAKYEFDLSRYRSPGILAGLPASIG